MTPPAPDVPAAVEAVRRRITTAAERAGRDPDTVRLIAVTKLIPAERIAALTAAGVRDIAESRVQEALHKQESLPHRFVWHLIGHLQTNKAPRAAAAFDAVHSVDSERVARALDAHRPPHAPPLTALIELELTGLPRRTGIPESQLESMARVIEALPRLRLAGLMTVAAFTPDAGGARATFAHLRNCRDRLQESLGRSLPELSMGMSGDFEVAIEEGATMVRIGQAVFGAR